MSVAHKSLTLKLLYYYKEFDNDKLYYRGAVDHDKFITFFTSYVNTINLYSKLEKKNVLTSLKTVIGPEDVEQIIRNAIETFNNDRQNLGISTMISSQFSCWLVRKLYAVLIDNLIPTWKEFVENMGGTKKIIGLGAYHLRWAFRNGTRRLTNTNKTVTRMGCNPTNLEKRDLNLYGCDGKKEPCPKYETLLKKFKDKCENCNPKNENDPIWLDFYSSAMRHNSDYDFMAQVGKFLDV